MRVVQEFSELLTPEFQAIRIVNQMSFVVPSISAAPSDALRISVQAAEPLGSHRIVTVDGFLATPSTLDKIVGVTSAAAILGTQANVMSKGKIEELSWNWIPNAPLFLGALGTLTQAVPVGNVRRVAWAMSPTTIYVDLMPPISQT